MAMFRRPPEKAAASLPGAAVRLIERIETCRVTVGLREFRYDRIALSAGRQMRGHGAEVCHERPQIGKDHRAEPLEDRALPPGEPQDPGLVDIAARVCVGRCQSVFGQKKIQAPFQLAG